MWKGENCLVEGFGKRRKLLCATVAVPTELSTTTCPPATGKHEPTSATKLESTRTLVAR